MQAVRPDVGIKVTQFSQSGPKKWPSRLPTWWMGEQSSGNISWSVTSLVLPMVIQPSYFHLQSLHLWGLPYDAASCPAIHRPNSSGFIFDLHFFYLPPNKIKFSFKLWIGGVIPIRFIYILYLIKVLLPSPIFSQSKKVQLQIVNSMGGSPGLVVMGGDSRSKGRGFKSWRQILDGHDIFSHWFVVKIVLFVWKDRNKRKRGRVGPFF